MPTPPRPTVLTLPAYALAEHDVPGVERIVHLGQNELGVEPSPRAVAAVIATATTLTRYPDDEHRALRLAIAQRHGLDHERILCGAGSMEFMGLLASAYCEADDEVVVSEYGYKYFQLPCALAGARVRVVPEPRMRADVEALAAQVGERTRLVFVAHPNNPTGASLAAGELRQLRDRLPEHVMLVVDGAYAEFAPPAVYEPGFDLVDGGENVAVLRTFSKAYGLAGLRIGWLYGTHEVVETLARVRVPSNVTTQALAAAEAAVADTAHLKQVVEEVVALREAFRTKVEALGMRGLPSDGNFVLVRCPDTGPATADQLFQGLKRCGIIVRPMQSYGLSDCLRVTIGSRDEMAFLARELERLVG